VYFPDANVLSTGDIVTLGARYPNIDFANGGNIKGMIAGADAFLALANSDTKVLPGHGPLTDRAGMTAYRDMLVTAQERVANLIAEGKSLDESVAAKPFADIGAKIGANEEQNANFVRVIYRSLKP
jgi:cyclase